MRQVDYLFWLKDKEDDLLAELEAHEQDLGGIPADDGIALGLAGDIIDDIEEELLIVRGIKNIVSKYLEVDDE